MTISTHCHTNRQTDGQTEVTYLQNSVYIWCIREEFVVVDGLVRPLPHRQTNRQTEVTYLQNSVYIWCVREELVIVDGLVRPLPHTQTDRQTDR